MLCADVLRSKELIADDEWAFFLRGGGLAVEKLRKLKPLTLDWINQQQWNNLNDLQNSFKCFTGILDRVKKDSITIHLGSFKAVRRDWHFYL